MKYRVLDTGKFAQYPDCDVNPSWNNSLFDTYKEAFDYAQNWLGMFRGLAIPVNTPIDYSGYKDTIEIREINE